MKIRQWQMSPGPTILCFSYDGQTLPKIVWEHESMLLCINVCLVVMMQWYGKRCLETLGAPKHRLRIICNLNAAAYLSCPPFLNCTVSIFLWLWSIASSRSVQINSNWLVKHNHPCHHGLSDLGKKKNIFRMWWNKGFAFFIRSQPICNNSYHFHVNNISYYCFQN